jgi:hypothetical protein
MPHPARPACSTKSAVSTLKLLALSHKDHYRLASLLILFVLSTASAGAHQGCADGESSADMCGQIGNDKSTLELKPDSPVKRDIKACEVHIYNLDLVAGQYVHLNVEQQGIYVSMRLYSVVLQKIFWLQLVVS